MDLGPGLDDLPLDEEPVDDVSSMVSWFDLVVALVLTVCTAFWGDLLGRGPLRDDYLASVVTSIGLVMPLALRRRNPLIMTGLMTVAGMAQAWLVATPTWALIAVPIACYSVARWVAGYSSRLVVVSGGLGSIVGPLRWTSIGPAKLDHSQLLSGVAPLMALCLAWVVIPYLLGRRDRETAIARHDHEKAARERYRAELARRDQQTRAAETRVRNEIARELHDVVAHSLGVIIVQANGGKALARKHPEAAAEVLDTISETGREALAEMRRIVGVLRADPDAPDSAEYQPAPGLADIPAMVAKAGDHVQLSITGVQPTVSAALGVTVYRVVQEGLTNVLKHAGPQARATVTLIYQPNLISVEVADDGQSGGSNDRQANPQVGSGYGLQGMAERVSAMGGEMTAHPLSGGGWVVRAALPTTGTTSHSGQSIGKNGAQHQPRGPEQKVVEDD